jgi:hypothetical protein
MLTALDKTATGGDVLYVASNLHMSALARTLGGALCHLDQRNPRRLIFHYSGVPADLDERVFRRELVVNISDYIASLEAIHALIHSVERGR